MIRYYVYDANYPMTNDDCGDLGYVDADNIEDATKQANAIWPNHTLYISE